ncbi:MAG: hypothetical protein Q4F57_05985 [Weeksellaceae bacterium]|nr:hypothetical protein [Weeksellaceae bacterium]
MAQTIDFEAIKNEIVRYGKANPLALERAILSPDIYINKFARPLGKVKGKWSLPSLFASHVVQIFDDNWNPYGDLIARVNEMQNFHQKVNFGLKPYVAYGTWLEDLYHEEKKPNEMPFSKYVIQNLVLPKITDDLNFLSVQGVYAPEEKNAENPRFGTSMNGLNTVIDNHVASGNVFTIPVDAGDNIVDQVTAFERQLPRGVRIKGIVLSSEDFDDYVAQRETPTDQFVNLKDPYRARTKYQREIFSVPGLTPGRIIAWVEGTFFRLYDRKESPARIDDVQVQDYEVKIFSQWHLGYDFGASEYLFVSSEDGDAVRGLGDEGLNEIIYPQDFNKIAR